MSNTRENLIAQYCKKKKDHDEFDQKVRDARFKRIELQKEYNKTEDWLKAIQSVGQIIGEV